MRMRAGTSTALCQLHHRHIPEPTYTELHHVIPQAWQVAWQPTKPWPLQGPSPDRARLVLWDSRTMPLCRTGHGNVHYWLVALMRELDMLSQAQHVDPTMDLYTSALKHVRRDARAAHRSMVAAELAVTELAIQRYIEAGGDLKLLISKQLWGEI